MIKCDKCKIEIDDDMEYQVLIGGCGDLLFDLCPDCWDAVKEFIKYGDYLDAIDRPYKPMPPISTRKFKLVPVEDEDWT